MTKDRVPLDGSYQQLDRIVVAFMQGRQGADVSVRAILASHGVEQIRAAPEGPDPISWKPPSATTGLPGDADVPRAHGIAHG